MDRDLNRALADAMSALPDEASFGHIPTGDQPQPGRVDQWISPQKRQLKNVRLGIDFSNQHLAIVELTPARSGWVVQALRSEEFSVPMDAHALAATLREFQPAPRIPVHLSLTSSRAVVRRFTFPPVPKHRRLVAAIWEAQKLIPFKLREQDAVFGFRFTRDAQSGWDATLAAVPREDAAPILDAIQANGWTLEGVSVSGTQVVERAGELAGRDAQAVAQVCWSRQRVTFAVHQGSRVVFHYDLGSIAGIDTPPGHAPDASQIRTWLSTLEKGIAEAIEFFHGTQTRLSLAGLELCGFSDALAPLITGWSDRFEIPVRICDPMQAWGCTLLADAASWLTRHDGLFTMALLAAVGTSSVDLTPASQLRRRNAQLHERLAISAGALSIVVMCMVSGYTWVHNRLTETSIAAQESQLAALEGSAVNAQLRTSIQKLTAITDFTGLLDRAPSDWSGFLKGLLRTFPEEARLVNLTLAPAAGGSGPPEIPQIRMEGRLLPTGLSHEIIYAEWVNDMEAITGQGAIKIASARELEWKGQVSSLFVIEIEPPVAIAGGGE